MIELLNWPTIETPLSNHEQHEKILASNFNNLHERIAVNVITVVCTFSLCLNIELSQSKDRLLHYFTKGMVTPTDNSKTGRGLIQMMRRTIHLFDKSQLTCFGSQS